MPSKPPPIYVPLTREQQALVRDNLNFVFKIASEFHKFGHREDLIAEGNFGLCVAASRFDPKRNVKFTTYSVHWIRAMIFRYLLRSHGQMHILSGRDRRVFFGLYRAYAALGEHQDDVKALAKYLGVDAETIMLVQARFRNQDFMIDAPRDGWRPFEVADRAPSIEDQLVVGREQQEISRRVRLALGRLDSRERLIVQGRIMDDQQRKLSDIGEELGGLSRERVRQLEVRARKKLRRMLVRSGLPALG